MNVLSALSFSVILTWAAVSALPADTSGIIELDPVSSDPAASPAPADTDIILSDTSLAASDSMPAIEKMPELVHFVKAGYPDSLIKKGVEGTVAMDLVVSDSGSVDSVAVAGGLLPALDSAAVRAARQFRFSPAVSQGKPIAVLLRYEYHFSIDEVVDSLALSDSVNFSGALVEMGTRTPVADAMVVLTFSDTATEKSPGVPFSRYLRKIGSIEGQYLEEDRLVTLSDSTGHFRFRGLPGCSLSVSVVLTGYKPFADEERISRAEGTDVLYRLERQSYSEYEIVVYGKAPKKEVAKRTLTLQEIKKIPGFGGDAVRVIQAMPGVARPFFGTGQIIVRGAGSGDNQYFLDGIPIPYVYHFGGLKSNYNSEALESVDFYPGGFGVRYGNALGGIIEIKGRQPKKDRWHGLVDVNLFDAAFLFETAVTREFSFLLSARRSYVADVLTFALEHILHQQLPFTVAPFYWDYLFRADYTPNPDHHFYLTLFGPKDKLELIQAEVRGGSVSISDNTGELSNENKFHIQFIGWDWKAARSLTNEFRYGLYEITDEVSILGYFNSTGKALAHGIRDQLRWAPDSALATYAGLDMTIVPYRHILATLSYTNAVEKDTTDFLFGPYAGYAYVEWKPARKLLLSPGLRYDYYPELDYSGSALPEFWENQPNITTRFSGEPSFRMSARYQLSDAHTVKGAAGTYTQTPQPLGQAIHKTWGNPYLPAEKGSQYVLGWEWQITDLVNLDLQGYYNRQWDNARMASNQEIAEQHTPPYLGNGRARMKGVELFLRHTQSDRFFGWVAYSLARSERWSYRYNEWVLYDRDILNNLQIIGSWRLPFNMEAGFRARYTDGYPVTPVAGIDYYDATYFYYQPKYGEPASERMAPYIGLDGRIEKKFVFNRWMLTAYLEAVNIAHYLRFVKKKDGSPLYEPPETDFYIYNYDYTQKNVLSDIPRVSVGISAEF
jgi:TonB family protein